jgi:flavin reductase (DIM6/NTAB) family NADH-FMN oxidoreductase RutF
MGNSPRRKVRTLMKNRKPDVSRMTLPCAVTLLSAGMGEKRDAMTATAMFVSEDPPLVVVSVGKNTFSHDLIEKSGEFVLNVAATGQVRLSKILGATHGAKVDKFKKFKVDAQEAESVSAPLIKGSFSHIECKVVTSFPVSHYVVYLAEVTASRMDVKKVPLAWHAMKYFSLDKEVK